VEVDTMNWDMPYRYSSKFQEHYHDHPVYQDYPVVNVSHQAAMQYCQWLTEKYHASNGRKFKEVRFRLPTAKEWELAAQGGDSSAIFPWEGTFVFNDQGNYQSNVREVIFDSFDFGVVWYDIEVIEPVKSFQKNTFGLYNMCGNVAEMIADSTLVKGGSWFDFSDWHEIKKSQPYDGGSNPTVGFRVFMEVIQK
jgi:formylglycine-generating enzyme required for sulfatase activity